MRSVKSEKAGQREGSVSNVAGSREPGTIDSGSVQCETRPRYSTSGDATESTSASLCSRSPVISRSAFDGMKRLMPDNRLFHADGEMPVSAEANTLRAARGMGRTRFQMRLPQK